MRGLGKLKIHRTLSSPCAGVCRQHLQIYQRERYPAARAVLLKPECDLTLAGGHEKWPTAHISHVNRIHAERYY